MCLKQVLITPIKHSMEGLIFEGYKIFIYKFGKFKNWNTEKIEYETNKWYEAKMNGDDKVGYETGIKYKLGFHIFVNEKDALEFLGVANLDNHPDLRLIKVLYKNINSVGYEENKLVVVAQHMFIPLQGLHIADLKPGDKFSFQYDGPINEMISVYEAFEVKNNYEIQKFVYIDVENRRLHARPDNTIVVRR